MIRLVSWPVCPSTPWFSPQTQCMFYVASTSISSNKYLTHYGLGSFFLGWTNQARPWPSCSPMAEPFHPVSARRSFPTTPIAPRRGHWCSSRKHSSLPKTIGRKRQYSKSAIRLLSKYSKFGKSPKNLWWLANQRKQELDSKRSSCRYINSSSSAFVPTTRWDLNFLTAKAACFALRHFLYARITEKSVGLW